MEWLWEDWPRTLATDAYVGAGLFLALGLLLVPCAIAPFRRRDVAEREPAAAAQS